VTSRKRTAPPAPPEPPAGPVEPPAIRLVDDPVLVDGSLLVGRRKAEYYEGERAQRQYERECGLLTPTDRVQAAVADAVTTLRQRLEQAPDELEPALAAARDTADRRAVLANYVEALLTDLADAFTRLAAGDAAKGKGAA
jgi:hypothetical protein